MNFTVRKALKEVDALPPDLKWPIIFAAAGRFNSGPWRFVGDGGKDNESMTRQEIADGLNCCQDVARSGLWACGCIKCPYREHKNPDDPFEGCREKLMKDAEAELRKE